MDSVKIKVRTPASIANLGPGFDVLAMAIKGLYDVVEVELSKGIETIDVDVEGFAEIPRGPGNVAYHVVKSFLESFGIAGIGIRVKVFKGVPPACGLGSSGATAAATAYALAQLLKKDMSEGDMVRIAAEGEASVAGAPHYDNVAASLFGGVVLVDLDKKRVYRIKPSKHVYISIIVPRYHIKMEKKTKSARAVLPKSIDMDVHTKQVSMVAKLIYALFTENVELLGEAISSDFVVEPHRAKNIPYYYELKEMALKLGAKGFNISGAGPSVFFIHESYEDALNIGEKLISFLNDNGVYSDLIVTSVSEKGAEVVR